MDKLRLTQAVIVEGKYDKIKLGSLVEGVILATGGFRIYRDRALQQTIRALANTCGIVVVTDSDRAGFQIRSFLGSIASGGKVTHVYIPDIPGKERRKETSSREGKLGVEGMDAAVLRGAFANAGVLEGTERPSQAITKTMLYLDGFSGGSGSARRRRALYRGLGLPERLSANSALPLLNQMLTVEEYHSLVEKIRNTPGE